MTPRNSTRAFLIWAYCEPKGWDVTIREIADALVLSPYTVSNILRAKGWNSRVRVNLRADGMGRSSSVEKLDFTGIGLRETRDALSDMTN